MSNPEHLPTTSADQMNRREFLGASLAVAGIARSRANNIRETFSQGEHTNYITPEELENLEPFEGFKEFETPEGLVEVSFIKGQNVEDIMWICECAEVESKNRKL